MSIVARRQGGWDTCRLTTPHTLQGRGAGGKLTQVGRGVPLPRIRLKTSGGFILIASLVAEDPGLRNLQGAWARFIDRQVVATIRPCFPQDR
jgi:hypothetical protein